MTTTVETQSICLEWNLPHPPAKVWRALTEPALVAAWLMPNDLRPEVGHAFTFRQEPTSWWDGIVHCEVQEIAPLERLQYSWKGGPASQKLDTVVTWTLTPTPSGGTRLALEHSGFVPTQKFAFDGARQGWQHKVGEGMAAVLEGL